MAREPCRTNATQWIGRAVLNRSSAPPHQAPGLYPTREAAAEAAKALAARLNDPETSWSPA